MGLFIGGFAAGAVCVLLALVAAGVAAMRWNAHIVDQAFDYGDDPRTGAIASGETL